MPYVPFHSLFPQLAEQETRCITLLKASDAGVPKGEYVFIEMFCDERGCDCRRVFFYVVSSVRKDLEAVVIYGWESPEFYARWLGTDAKDMLEDMKGPGLNLFSPQSQIAPGILELFREYLLPDEDYMERVKRHYALFREAVEAGSSHERSAPRRHKRRRRKLMS